MANYVGGCGNACAKLLIVGDAPGAHEVEIGTPFAGPSGSLVDECLRAAGMTRDEVYLTNVVKVRPPNNEIKRLGELGVKVEDFLPQLWEEINTIKPNCILALGGTALKALTGLDGIQKYRGSILPNCHSALPKVVPSIHPASLMHASKEMQNWKVLQYIKFDFIRAAQQSLFSDIRSPQRTLTVARNSLDVIRYMERHANATETSLDVETFKTIPLCIGLSASEHEAISVPLLNHITATNPDGIPLHDQLYIWKLIGQYLYDLKIRKIAQNAKFDQRICENVRLNFKTYWDTMLAWHTLFLEMPKNLAFITSILTEEPYYKDEGKEYNPKKDKFDRLLLYNAKDAVVTYEIKQREEELLNKLNLTDFFFNRMMPLHDMYYEIESKGILIDLEVREELRSKYKGIRKERHQTLVDTVKKVSNLTDFDVNVNSPKQAHKMIYQLLGCPLRKDTRKSTLQALANNAVKDVNKKEIIKLTLEERKISKTIGTYINTPPSEDGRIRTQFKITGTETGRTSTEKLEPPISVIPEGMALQTLSKHGDVGSDLRRMFIAKPGFTLVEADGAQAEDRVVAILAKDWEALRLLEKTEFIYNRYNLKDDRHTLTAMLVTGKAFEEINEEDRQIGKRARHAANYDVGKHQLMVTLAGENVFVSEWKAGKYLEKIHNSNPNIRNVFHAEIEQALQESSDRSLTAPFGRFRIFFNRWGRDLFKEAYAYIPQSTISDWMKFAMIEIAKEYGSIPYLLDAHDSFLAEIPDEEVEAFCKIARKHLEVPINFTNCSLSRDVNLVIPAEFKIGKCWYNLEKYRVLG